jgi:site-specific recombinase XerC
MAQRPGAPGNRRYRQKKNPAGCTIRHRLAALSSLFEYLCDQNPVTHNPVKGVSVAQRLTGASARTRTDR